MNCCRSLQSSSEDAAQRSLADTLGSETSVLVVVDPKEFPRTWKSVDLLEEAIGEAEYRELRSTSQTQHLKTAADDFRKIARVTLGDYHLDAKLFPHCLVLRERHPQNANGELQLLG